MSFQARLDDVLGSNRRLRNNGRGCCRNGRNSFLLVRRSRARVAPFLGLRKRRDVLVRVFAVLGLVGAEHLRVLLETERETGDLVHGKEDDEGDGKRPSRTCDSGRQLKKKEER